MINWIKRRWSYLSEIRKYLVMGELVVWFFFPFMMYTGNFWYIIVMLLYYICGIIILKAR